MNEHLLVNRKKPKIILWDIETLPDMEEAMKVWPKLSDYPGQSMKATITSIICGGYKELDSKQTHCINAWDFPAWKKDVNDDYAIVKKIYDVLKDADAVVTHNGKRFDWKHLQTRLLVHGMDPLHEIHHIDTCKLAKGNILAFNNSLDILAKAFVKDKKMENGGWDLWVRVRQREKKAMDMMSRYCKHDVKILEKIFKVLRPFAKNIPNFNVFADDVFKHCRGCGSTNLMKFGFRPSSTGVRQRYSCKDCGTSSYGAPINKKPVLR